MHGAQSVRLDVSRDGAVWETGVVYTSATSGLDAGTTRSASLEASCFNISAVTSRYVRVFLGAGATAGWIGVGVVGFKCEVEATPAPTAAPTAPISHALAIQLTVIDELLTPCNNLATREPFWDACASGLRVLPTYTNATGHVIVLDNATVTYSVDVSERCARPGALCA